MEHSRLCWILQLIIYCALIIQLLYFLISSVCYIYHNPQYRVFWALFYLNSPTNANIKSTDVPLPTIARVRDQRTTESADTPFRNLPAPPSTQRTSRGTSSQQSAQPTDVPFQIDH
eukprot:164029_1